MIFRGFTGINEIIKSEFHSTKACKDKKTFPGNGCSN